MELPVWIAKVAGCIPDQPVDLRRVDSNKICCLINNQIKSMGLKSGTEMTIPEMKTYVSLFRRKAPSIDVGNPGNPVVTGRV